MVKEYEENVFNGKSNIFIEYAIDNLVTIMMKIRDVDFQEVFRLVSLADSAAGRIENQHIIMLLGGTGAGKSTSILYLSGNEMRATVIDGLDHIEAVNQKNKLIKCSPDMKSTTRYITAEKVILSEIDVETDLESIYLVDTPGFEDQNGVEVDLANSLGIVKAIRKAKSVRPVAVFSYVGQGNKFEGAKNIAHILVRMIKDVKSHLDSISYVFTKYPIEKQNQINATIKNFLKNMNQDEKADKNFVSFIQNMSKKTKCPIIINPLDNTPNAIMEELIEIDPIQHPEEVFAFSITQDSLNSLNNQILKHKNAIQVALNKENFEYIDFRFSELIQFQIIFEIESVQNSINDIKQQINHYIRKIYEETTQKLNKCLKNNNSLTIDDINQYKISFDYAKKIEFINQKYLSEETISSTQYLQNVIIYSKKLSEEIQEYQEIEQQNFKDIIDKQKLLLLIDPSLDLSEIYFKSKIILDIKIKAILQKYQSLFNEQQYTECLEQLSILEIIIINLKDHISDDNKLQEQIKDLKSQFSMKFIEFTDQITQILSQQQFKSEHIDIINKLIEQYENAIIATQLKQIIQSQEIIQEQKKAENKIINKIQEYADIIQIKIKNQPEKNIQDVEAYFFAMVNLKQIKGIEQYCSELFYNSLECVIQFIKEKKRDIEYIITLSMQSTALNFAELSRNLKILSKAKWIQKYKTGIYEDVINIVSEKILTYTKQIEQQTIRLQIDLENHKNLLEYSKLIDQLSELSDLQEYIPELSDKITKAQNKFLDKIKQQFETIHNISDFQLIIEKQFGIIEHKKVEHAIIYLLKCQDITIIQDLNIFKEQQLFDEFLTSYQNHIKKQMNDCLNEIQEQTRFVREIFNINIQLLASRLSELQEIQQNYQNIQKKFGARLNYNQYQDKLKSFQSFCTNELLSFFANNQNDQFIQQLDIVKAMSELDCFIDQQNSQYITLYRLNFDKFYKQVPINVKEMLQFIDANDYQQVASNIANFQINDPLVKNRFEQISNSIKKQLENISETTKSKALQAKFEKMEINDIDTIAKNIQILLNWKSLGPDVISQQKLNEIDSNIKQIYATIKEGVEKKYEVIMRNIKSYDFFEANQQINNLDLIAGRMYQSPCIEEIKQRIEESKEAGSNKLEEIIQDINKKDTQELKHYNISSLFQKLEKNTIYQAEIIQELRSIILIKFEAKLQSILDAPDSILSKNRAIKMLKSSLSFMPPEISQRVNSVIENAIADIEIQTKQFDEQLEESKKQNDIQSLMCLYKNQIESPSQTNSTSIIKNYVKEQVQTKKEQIILNLKNGQLDKSMEDLQSFAVLKKSMDDQFKLEINYTQPLREIASAFQNKLKFEINILIKFFDNKSSGNGEVMIMNKKNTPLKNSLTNKLQNDNAESDQIYQYKSQPEEKSFQIVNIFIYNIEQLKSIDINCEKELKNLLNHISTALLLKQQFLDDGFQSYDINKINDALSSIKKYNIIQGEFINNIKEYSKYKLLDNSQTQKVKQCKSQQEMVVEVSSFIEQNQQYIKDIEINNTETKNDKDRELFYISLNKQLVFLSQSKKLSNFIDQEVINESEISLNIIQSKMEQVITNSVSLIKQAKMDEQTCKDFSSNYENIKSFATNVKITKFNYQDKLKDIRILINNKITSTIQVFETMMLVQYLTV